MAFYYNQLTNIDIPDSVTSIGFLAFARATLINLTLTSVAPAFAHFIAQMPH
jgi:hypothetical protein